MRAVIKFLVFLIFMSSAIAAATYNDTRTCVDPAGIAVATAFVVQHGACAGRCAADPMVVNATTAANTGMFRSTIAPGACDITFTFYGAPGVTVVPHGWRVCALCSVRND